MRLSVRALGPCFFAVCIGQTHLLDKVFLSACWWERIRKEWQTQRYKNGWWSMDDLSGCRSPKKCGRSHSKHSASWTWTDLVKWMQRSSRYTLWPLGTCVTLGIRSDQCHTSANYYKVFCAPPPPCAWTLLAAMMHVAQSLSEQWRDTATAIPQHSERYVHLQAEIIICPSPFSKATFLLCRKMWIHTRYTRNTHDVIGVYHICFCMHPWHATPCWYWRRCMLVHAPIHAPMHAFMTATMRIFLFLTTRPQ